jgi:hypothetical protein
MYHIIDMTWDGRVLWATGTFFKYKGDQNSSHTSDQQAQQLDIQQSCPLDLPQIVKEIIIFVSPLSPCISNQNVSYRYRTSRAQQVLQP